MEQTLELAGFNVDVHAMAAGALQVIAPAMPVVVLSDVKVRGANGLEQQQRIMSIDRDIPVILTTGDDDIA